MLTNAPDASAKTINLKFATGFSPKHTMQVKVFEPWAKKINEMTNGQVKITFFPQIALFIPSLMLKKGDISLNQKANALPK